MILSRRLIAMIILSFATFVVLAEDAANATSNGNDGNTVSGEALPTDAERSSAAPSIDGVEGVSSDGLPKDAKTRKRKPKKDSAKESGKTASSKERVVEIKSARSTEYVKEDGSSSEGTTEFVKLSGDVIIEVSEGASKSTISADEILYNKSRDTLEARGNVRYLHSSGKSGGEEFVGEALLFNVEKQEGVFLKGAMKQDSGKKSSDPYIVHAEVTGRDSSSTIAFKKGVLTTCDAEDPHWAIRASRIWLLPGNEIALLNGVFFIGPLPVFYIPFFYYPADEMIFHPVFGYRNREGYFVQTTTYLYGRKPLDTVKNGEENSFANFMQGDTLKEQERHGLFLKNLPEDAGGNTRDYLKIMADGYSGLGAAVGVAGSFSNSSYLKSLTFSTMLGFSRTLYAPDSGLKYSTYDSAGEQNYNKSRLFGNEMPFRYRNDFTMNVDKSPVSVSLSLPLVSDQEFKKDFQDRSENLNWFKLLTQQDKLSEGTETSDETTFAWSFTASVTPNMGFANPWLTTASITSLSTTLTFNSKTNASLSGEELAYAPGKTFFYPEILKPSVKLSFAGTLYDSAGRAPKANPGKTVDTGSLSNPFKDTDAGKGTGETGGDTAKAQDADGKPTDGESEGGAPAEKGAVNASDFMAKGGTALVPSPRIAKNAFSVTWSFAPTLTMENRYDPSRWNAPDDIDWNSFSSQYYQVDTATKLLQKYSYDEDFVLATSSLDFTNTKQEHTRLSGPNYDTDQEIDAVKLADYKATTYKLATTEGFRVIPFNRNPFLKPISASWDFTGALARSVFDGTAANPSWNTETFEWDEDYVDKHTATFVLGIAPGNYEQKISLTSNLPPLLESYTGAANMSWRYGTVAMTTRLYEKNSDDKTWTWDPFSTVVAWKLPLGVTLGQEYVYDIENKEPSRLNLTGAVGPFSLFYTLTNTVPYRLRESGWVLDGTENQFIPTAMGLAFNNSSKPLKVYSWKNRFALQATLESNLRFDLNRLTESSFDFKPRLTLKISDFLDLSFSSTSSNEVIARYFQDWMDLPSPLPGESNVGKDLLNSFNFFDKGKREQSGFKLKSLSLGITHYLHDWTATLDTTVAPELKADGNRYYYEFIPTVKFVVSWKPISDIKTTVKSEESVFSLNTMNDETDTTGTTTP
jgi:hypothetical protein